MGLKSAVSIYDILKKATKTDPFDEINNQPYYKIPEYIYQKAAIYQMSEITDALCETAAIYEIEALEADIRRVLKGEYTKGEFEAKYCYWSFSIPMFAQPMYEKFQNMVKNEQIDPIGFYYLGVELTTKSDNVAVAAIGIMILSQFQNDISEEIFSTLAQHCRLSYYCVLGASKFKNSTRILRRMLNNANSNSTMIMALALNYENKEYIDWLFEYGIKNSRDMATLAYKLFKNRHVKKYLSNLEIDENSFSTLTKLLTYGIGRENIMQYSLYDSNFIAEFLVKLLANFEAEMCKTLPDYCFLVMAMHLLTGMKEAHDEIKQELERIQQESPNLTRSDFVEIKRNIIKERIFMNALLHNDYLSSIYNIRMNIDPEELEDEEIDELISQLNEMMQSEDFSPSNEAKEDFGEEYFPFQEEYSRGNDFDAFERFDEESDGKNNRRNRLFFNESIKNTCEFIERIFENHPRQQELILLSKHAGNFQEDFTLFHESEINRKLSEIDSVFRSEVFLDDILDEIQFIHYNPYVYLPVLALFNIIPEFPYFHKMIEDYPLSREFLNFALWQFPYYHLDLCEYALHFMKKAPADEDIYTDQYVISMKDALTQWVDAILEKYEKDVEVNLSNLDFLCRSFAFLSDSKIPFAVKMLKDRRTKLSNRHFEFLYDFTKNSQRANVRRKLANFLGFTQAQIKNSKSFHDALEKYRNHQNDNIIQLPKIKKK